MDERHDPASEHTAGGDGNTTMNYMLRFGCIGPKCEENCCQDGWRIDVDRNGYKRLVAATQFAPRDIGKRVLAAIRVVPAKSRSKPETYTIRLDNSGACPLFDDGWCAIHSNFGLDMLPHVCAVYPRKIFKLLGRHELSATASCPEIARQLLLKDDAADVVPLDLSTLNRVVLQESMDPRDTRPFFRAMIDVRDAMMGLLRDTSMTLEERQFLILWFAKRTSDVLRKGRTSGDLAPVERELALVMNPRARLEILKRFDGLETIAAVAVYVARAIIRPKVGALRRPRWQALVDTIIGGLAPLHGFLPNSEEEGDHERAAQLDVGAGAAATAAEVFGIYKARRDRLRAIPEVAARIDQFFRNYMLHTWFHRAPTEEADLKSYVLRMFAQQACQKLLLYTHVDLQAALDRFDADASSDRPAALAALLEAVDARAVDAFYQLARHIEHGQLIKWLVSYLGARGLDTIAGGVHLIRF